MYSGYVGRSKNNRIDVKEIQDRINKSNYNLYAHKHTKKILLDILNEYFDDYEIEIFDTDWGHKRLMVRVFDKKYMPTTNDVYISFVAMEY